MVQQTVEADDNCRTHHYTFEHLFLIWAVLRVSEITQICYFSVHI